MARALVSDELWSRLSPILPPEREKPLGGRPRVPDRAALTGILFVLRTGIQWGMLPLEMGCGSGVTCWRRMRDWTEAGVWSALHRLVLDELGAEGGIDWSRAAIDGSNVAAKKGAPTKSARTRPIAVGPARSTTLSSTARGFHSLSH
jgi:transposase